MSRNIGAEPASREERSVGERRFTIMLVPEGASGPLRQRSFTMRDVRTLVVSLLLLFGMALMGAALLVGSVSGRFANGVIVEENLELKARLYEIESKLDRVDQEMQRLRLYGTQLQDLPEEAIPGFGPIDDEDFAAAAALGEGLFVGEARLDWLGESGEPMDDLPSTMETGLTARLDRLEIRADNTLQSLRVSEIVLGHAVEAAEHLRARQDAIPSLWPLSGVLTSGFGWRRSPFTKRWKFHSGLDLSAPKGTPVMAPASGVVRTARFSTGYGRMVELDHGFGIMTRFAHNSRVYVKAGDKVRAGQVISTVGMTGQTTGPHLHYEVHIDGQPVDPLEYLQ